MFDCLRELREYYGTTIDSVAEKFNVEPSLIETWENGTQSPTDKQVEELASLYVVTPHFIRYGVPDGIFAGTYRDGGDWGTQSIESKVNIIQHLEKLKEKYKK